MKEKKTRFAIDDIWDLIYKINYRFDQKGRHLEVVRTIIYVKTDDTVSKIRIL